MKSFKSLLLILLIISCISHVHSQSIWTWGQNMVGQLGKGDFFDTSSTPIMVNFSSPIMIATGNEHTIAIKQDGTVWNWGDDEYGQIGNGTFINTDPLGVAVPTRAIGVNSIMAVTAGQFFTLALAQNGTMLGWGYNADGELGNGIYTTGQYPGIPTAVSVSNLSNVISIGAGEKHSFAIKHDGTVYSWGRGTSGQLGNGTWINRNTPGIISSLSNVVSVTGGYYHSLALKADGTVWAWGDGEYGQLSNGLFMTSSPYGVNTPIKIANFSNIIAIAAGQYHNLALKADGTVWSWGYNFFGELGNGNYNNSATAAKILSLSNVVAISAGNYFSLALKNDGTVWAWGQNIAGELGTAITATKYATPVQVNGLSGIAQISAGGEFGAALQPASPKSFTGTVMLQGWVALTLPNVFVSVDGGPMQGVSLIQTGPLTGTFSMPFVNTGTHTVKVKVNGFLSQKVTVTTTGAVTSAAFNGPYGFGMLLGDTNGDEIIDDADLLIVINHFLQTTSVGDTDGDHVVSDKDLLNVINNFLSEGD